jgi:hypothetical protein
MRRIEELFAYSLSTIIFLLGLTLIFLSLLIENGLVSSILIGFGIALCPAGLIGFLFQYLNEKVFVKKIESLIISKSIPQEIGIKRVFHNRKEFHEIRLNLYSNARDRIYYLAVCPGYKDPGVFPGIEEWLKRGVNIRFLVCSPNTPFITQWFGINSDAYPKASNGGIERCLQELWAVKKKNDGPGKIDIKIYSGSPGYYMQIIDDRLFVEPYLYGANGSDALMIEFEKGHQFNLFFDHFKNLWEASKPIDDFFENVKSNNLPETAYNSG